MIFSVMGLPYLNPAQICTGSLSDITQSWTSVPQNSCRFRSSLYPEICYTDMLYKVLDRLLTDAIQSLISGKGKHIKMGNREPNKVMAWMSASICSLTDDRKHVQWGLTLQPADRFWTARQSLSGLLWGPASGLRCHLCQGHCHRSCKFEYQGAVARALVSVDFGRQEPPVCQLPPSCQRSGVCPAIDSFSGGVLIHRPCPEDLQGHSCPEGCSLCDRRGIHWMS